MLVETLVKKRSKPKTKVNKEIYKVISNSAFGKVCESVCIGTVVTNPEKCARIIANPNYTSFTIISSDMVALNKEK